MGVAQAQNRASRTPTSPPSPIPSCLSALTKAFYLNPAPPPPLSAQARAIKSVQTAMADRAAAMSAYVQVRGSEKSGRQVHDHSSVGMWRV